MATLDLLDLDIPLRVLDSSKDPRAALFSLHLAREGGTLAATAPPSSSRHAPDDADGEQIAAQAWSAALRARITKANGELPRHLAAIRRARRAGLAIQFFTALSASGVIGLVLVDSSQAAEIAAAIISLAGTLASIAVTYATKDDLGNDRVQRALALQDTIAEADSLALELDIWAMRPPPRPPLDPDHLKRAKELVASFINNS